MPLPLAVSATPVGLMQRMAAGSKFTGALPAGEPTIQNGINKYTEGTVGGLFYFRNPRSIVVPHYHIDFGASVAYEVAIVSLDANKEKIAGDRIIIAKGTAAFLQNQDRFGMTLGPHQAVEVTISGSTTAPMIATFWAMDATAFFG